MESSDDEKEIVECVSNYHFLDEKEEPVSFSVLPVIWSENEGAGSERMRQLSLRGATDNGLRKVYKEVTAWKFDLSSAKNAEISVLTKENSWIKLEKPRKSFEETIRTVLITLQCLHYARRNPEASGKSVWDYMSRVFSPYEVRPSLNDLVDHVALVSEAVSKDDSLAKSKFLLMFLEEKPMKNMLSDEDVKATVLSGFINDDDEDDCVYEDLVEDDANEEDDNDLFDSVCAFCDNGGNLLCCEGKCMRSFHASEDAESQCISLGFTSREVKAMQNFVCSNCKYMKHQCFACGKLGSSDKTSGAEVFQCANATCGYFYHPHCLSKLLHPTNEVAAKELQEKIISGESVACSIHKCCVCKQGENKKEDDLQFAICRRCPTSYHRKCLPREIVFENEEKEEEVEDGGYITRAWTGLLPNRILIYCLKHEIDEDIGTPKRDHIIFPVVEIKKTAIEQRNRQTSESASSGKVLPKKRRLNSDESVHFKSGVKAPKATASSGKKPLLQKIVGLNSSKKLGVSDTSRKFSKENGKSVLSVRDGPAMSNLNKASLGELLFDFMAKSELVEDTTDSELDETVKLMTTSQKSNTELDEATRKRILALMNNAASSISLEDVIKEHEVPSTHTYSSKGVVDKTITFGKVEGAVEAVRTALRKLDNGCSIEDAKAVCEPEVLDQLLRWKNKLKVYLAPFLNGKRYTSFGRHFTKVEKLEEIVNMVHWYVQSGDMVVDFCCGANDFSCLMKKKLEETGKKCLYKNYDVFQPKNDFNFEKRDWMTVHPNELPKGSQLIMGLNPPFGVHATLANKFVAKALEFKPKLLILIVPPETDRLEKNNYHLVWEDEHFLSGKSFYLPGSVDEDDRQMDQWNLTAPVLYLWSRSDWSAKHRAIAQKHGHGSKQQERLKLEKDDHETDICGHPILEQCNGNPLILKNGLPMQIKLHEELNLGVTTAEGHKQKSPSDDGDKESQDSHGPGKSKSNETSRKMRHGQEKFGRVNEKSPTGRKDFWKPPVSGAYQEMPCHSLSSLGNGRPSLEDHQKCRSSLDRKRWTGYPGITMADGHKQNFPCDDSDKESQGSHGPGKTQSTETPSNRRFGEQKVGREDEKSLREGKIFGKPPGSDMYKVMPYHSSLGMVNGTSSLEGHQKSRSHDTSSPADVGDNGYPRLEQGTSNSHMQYGVPRGTTQASNYGDVNRRYSMISDGLYSRGIHQPYGGISMEEQHAAHVRSAAESAGYRFYATGLERDSAAWLQGRIYGKDHNSSFLQTNTVSHDQGYGQIRSLSSGPFGHLGSPAESYGMNMSATQRYAPQLDELNHVRMNSLGSEPPLFNGNGIYDPRAPRPGHNVDAVDFAPGPYYPYSNNSAGWLD